MTIGLRSPAEVERIAQSMERFVQTIRARSLRIDQIRKMLATLNNDERFGLACELLETNEDELIGLIERIDALRDALCEACCYISSEVTLTGVSVHDRLRAVVDESKP